MREEVAAFADGPDNVGRDESSALNGAGHDRHDLMIGVIQRWTHEIVHRSIDNDEFFAVIPLAIDHPREQRARRGR